MKYFSLHASLALATAAILSGCGGDLTRTHDIYRNEYKYTPVSQKEEAVLPPTPTPTQPAPTGMAPTEPAPATDAAPVAQ